MKLLGLSLALLLAAAPAAAHHSSRPGPSGPAELRYTGPDGTRWSARIPDVDQVTTGCLVARRGEAVRGPVLQAELFVGGQPAGRFRLYGSGSERYLLSTSGGLVPPGTWCRLRPEVVQALDRARRLPASRGPWLAFIGVLGGLALAVGLVALWGQGVGPQPTLASGPPGQPAPP